MSANQRVAENIDLFHGKYRVRLKGPHGEIRRYFDDLAAAERELAKLRRRYPKRIQHGIQQVPSEGTSHPRVGVTRRLRIDRRKAAQPTYLVFSVNWKDADGRLRITGFQAGNSETVTAQEERHAEQTAVAFREAYEWARINNLKFRPEAFSCWRSVQCYPWRNPRDWSVSAKEVVSSHPDTADELSAAVLRAFLQGPVGS